MQDFTSETRQQEREPKGTLTPQAKTSNRMRYEAEVEVLKNQFGNIDQIREHLGLSKRRFCQLLFVDPSAFTRWEKSESGPPPWVYRALSWYLLLKEKHPLIAEQMVGLSRRNESAVKSTISEMKEESVNESTQFAHHLHQEMRKDVRKLQDQIDLLSGVVWDRNHAQIRSIGTEKLVLIGFGLLVTGALFGAFVI